VALHGWHSVDWALTGNSIVPQFTQDSTDGNSFKSV
jgi:hypothetical protein